jgi:hypothetical protein
VLVAATGLTQVVVEAEAVSLAAVWAVFQVVEAEAVSLPVA